MAILIDITEKEIEIGDIIGVFGSYRNENRVIALSDDSIFTSNCVFARTADTFTVYRDSLKKII